jgi:hypothetical protein
MIYALLYYEYSYIATISSIPVVGDEEEISLSSS